MRTVVIGVEGIEPGRLLDDRRLIQVQALLEEGIIGRLQVDRDEGMLTIWSALSQLQDLNPAAFSMDPGCSGTLSRSNAGANQRVSILFGLFDENPATTRCFDGADHEHHSAVESDRNRDDHGLRIEWPTVPEGREGDESLLRIRTSFTGLRHRMGCQPWSVAAIVFEFLVQPKSSGEGLAIDNGLAIFDDELRLTLELLLKSDDEVTILLIVLGRHLETDAVDADCPTSSGAFVISSSRGLPAGEIEGARMIDLVPTLLKMAGKPIPSGLTGMPLELDRVASQFEEDENAVQERLRGLGYLA